MIESKPSPNSPSRAAIIGSGPAGLYTATELLKAYPDLHIDIFEQNWAPFGLIRYGVAPDHQKTKRVTTLLSRTLQDSRVRFFGGISVGGDLSLEELDAHYSLVAVATGAEKAKTLALANSENFPTGLDIVTWYNGHPSNLQAYHFDFERLVIVGNGNVALDIARLLCQPEATLRATDLSENVLTTLLNSKVREIHIVGRRGPAQIAFRPPELKELTALQHVELSANSLALDDIDLASLDLHENVLQKKGLTILQEATAQVKPNATHRIHFHFNRKPIALAKDYIELGATVMDGAPLERHAVLTQDKETIACGQIIQSIGYYGTAPEGLPTHKESGTLKTCNHKVVLSKHFQALWLASGWIKTGPQGLIGHNHMDAVQVVRSLHDHEWKPPCSDKDIVELLTTRKLKWVDAATWAKLDQQEVNNGKVLGKVREKIIHPEL